MLNFVFFGITLLTVFLFYYGLLKDKRVLTLSVIWLGAYGWLAYTGYFKDTDASPPPFLVLLSGSVVLTVILYRLVRAIKIRTDLLMAVHIVRIPVELVLYQLYLQNEVPLLMTFKGYNLDILIGISALILWVLIKFTNYCKSTSYVLVGWSVIGIFSLFSIVLIAILSSPTPFQQFGFEQPNVAVLRFPFIYLPAIVVPMVFLSHVLVIEVLLIKDG